jgi:hypothetical protein
VDDGAVGVGVGHWRVRVSGTGACWHDTRQVREGEEHTYDRSRRGAILHITGIFMEKLCQSRALLTLLPFLRPLLACVPHARGVRQP